MEIDFEKYLNESKLSKKIMALASLLKIDERYIERIDTITYDGNNERNIVLTEKEKESGDFSKKIKSAKERKIKHDDKTYYVYATGKSGAYKSFKKKMSEDRQKLKENQNYSPKQQAYANRVEQVLSDYEPQDYMTGASIECEECRAPYESDYNMEIEQCDEMLANEEITQEEHDRCISRLKSDLEQDMMMGSGDSNFSTQSCDLCRTALHGDRVPLHVISKEDGAMVHLDICKDCEDYQHTYGEYVPEDENLLDDGRPGWPDND